MTFEVQNTITSKDLVIVTLKVYYQKLVFKILVAAGVSIIVLLLVGLLKINGPDKLNNAILLLVIIINLVFPMYLVFYARNLYATSKLYQNTFYYKFDEDKISYKGDGEEGDYDWKLITKYTEIKHFILLYFSSQQLIFIKTSSLTNQQLKFIKSKIKQPE